MPRKIIPKECACGCGKMTKGGQYIAGHNMTQKKLPIPRGDTMMALLAKCWYSYDTGAVTPEEFANWLREIADDVSA
tara:strand:- start:163 stop:393 length:231 start_codon:yes stop_codon:yes gene_type:complete